MEMNKMRYIISILAFMALVMIVSAYDQRDGSNGVPYLPSDPSLVTSDPFYKDSAHYIGPAENPAYQLPAIFADEKYEPAKFNDPWMNSRTSHVENKKITVIAKSSYDLPEYLTNDTKNIPLGSESWL